MNRARILLIDDEAPLRESLRFAFAREGFDVLTAADGPSGVELAHQHAPDAIVLDLRLPGLDGFEVCERILARLDVPVLMLTARDQTADKLRGFELGADDYVTKPFNTRELLARVRALLRRRERARALLDQDRVLVARLEEMAARDVRPGRTTETGGAAPRASRPLTAGAITLDLDRGVVTIAGREGEVALGAPESRLLAELARHPGRVVTRTELIAALFDRTPDDAALALLEAHVRVLREKLEADPARPARVVTVPGIGYRLA